jgi:hypothetical protein
MTKEVHGFEIYGMWGPVTDPGAKTMTQRMAELPGINMHDSPYRDYDVNEIVGIIGKLPTTAIILICGTSLGANNTPVTAAYAYLNNPKRIIHGIWGFQASIWGAKAGATSSYPGITRNVQFAHLISSDFPLNAGLGAYRWVSAPGNTVTNGNGQPLLTTHDYPHPGDGVVADQDMFLAEMKRVIANADAS